MKYVRRTLVGIVLVLAVVYVGDDLAARLPIPRGRNPYGTVRVRRYYAVPLKDQKTEFIPGDAQTATCVHCLFPHFGYSPCWYLERHQVQRINE